VRPRPAALIDAARESGLATAEVCATALERARRTRSDPLELLAMALRLPQEAFYRAWAAQQGLGFVGAAELVACPQALGLAPARVWQRAQALPLGGGRVATANPGDLRAVEPLQRALGEVEWLVAEPQALAARLRELAATGSQGFDAIDALGALLQRAWLQRASDLHLDPLPGGGLRQRLRVDGRLVEVGSLAAEDGLQLVTRVKVLAGLDIAERRRPHDGGFTHDLGEGCPVLDVRVATIPTRHGERATLRLLGSETLELSLDTLGFAPGALARLRGVLAAPHGLVLLTGPTGSGKSTTLYAALRELNQPELNLLTVEDPVECVLPGVAQIQVDRVGKVTFAGALRALLRHDPDVLMVGEIRDPETAGVALQAAQTGHLVLSSLHTNSAATAVERMLDLGADPFPLASALRAVLAQRLLRRLCPACRSLRPANADEVAQGLPAGSRLADPGGCPACVGTGYRGRLALLEALWFEEPLREAVLRRAPARELRQIADRLGFPSLRADALLKAAAGQATLVEALRAGV